LRIEYYENTGNASAKLAWFSASQAREVVPQGVLFPANTPPTLFAIPTTTILAGRTLFVTNNARDADLPAQTLTWSLQTQPAGASINVTKGLITWRPPISQSLSTNLFTVTVTDSGTPTMIPTQSFNVIVSRPATPAFASPNWSAGSFKSFISGSAGPDYSIYTSTNLTSSWQLLLTTNPALLPFMFVDPAATKYQ
jgi:hypothetical protein